MRVGASTGLWVTLWAFASTSLMACPDEPDLALGPPRCEPARELEHERSLKTGFRALLEGDADRARAAFAEVEREEPGHPEAALGLRLASRSARPRVALPGSPSVVSPAGLGGGFAARHEVVLAGGRADFPVPVVTDRYRFEDLAAMMPMRHKRDGSGPIFSLYRERQRSGTAISARDRDAVRGVIDLIVLHDTRTQTALESVIELEGQGGSTHFIIDWDGTVYQTLDLAFEANHVKDASVDGRSVAIDLVNPVVLESSPKLPDGSGERTLSAFVKVHGEEVQNWGYTEAQLASLEKVVSGLLTLLPQVKPKVVEVAGAVPRTVFEDAADFSGIAGHLHLSRRAVDPGAGFPWERLRASLPR